MRPVAFSVALVAAVTAPAPAQPLLTPTEPDARIAAAVSYDFPRKQELFFSCSYVPDEGGADPSVFIARWIDHDDPFMSGGGWTVGHGSFSQHARITAEGRRMDVEAGSPFVATASGDLGGVRGNIAGGSRMRIAWASWDATVDCVVEIDGVRLTPRTLAPGEYGRVRAADQGTGVGVDTGPVGATVLGDTGFMSDGYLLGVGTPRVGESVSAVSPEGETISSNGSEPLFLHHRGRGEWHLRTERSVRQWSTPILYWASFPN